MLTLACHNTRTHLLPRFILKFLRLRSCITLLCPPFNNIFLIAVSAFFEDLFSSILWSCNFYYLFSSWLNTNWIQSVHGFIYQTISSQKIERVFIFQLILLSPYFIWRKLANFKSAFQINVIPTGNIYTRIHKKFIPKVALLTVNGNLSRSCGPLCSNIFSDARVISCILGSGLSD